MKPKDKANSNGRTNEDRIIDVLPVSGMYQNWFLDYASYVILERAVPALDDGLKPVQRRILHAMKEMDDGRYNKVANIIGQTMQYHPHGDASIADAIVHLGQKDLLIDTQGNWGDVRTGDSAAASRYIEARLSKLAIEVIFNAQTTEWQLAYDGRKKEPISFPVKFPLLLAQGVEGIAVGLSTRILPHNFCELIQASIEVLKKKKVNILPDFPTGGTADFSEYNQGQKGGKVRVRAKIEALDKKTLIIKDIPYGITTITLIESIVRANEKGKIKIKKVVDNTAQDVEILVHLGAGQSPDIGIDALYAFTDCEISISPSACVVSEDTPKFASVNDILKINTGRTEDLLRRELEIRKSELLEKILFSSLEKIFIENRIYRDIEDCESWEAVLATIDAGLAPFKKQFYRKITTEDIVKLTEIKIKRISRYDSFKADEILEKLEDELVQVEHDLKNLTEFAINYFKSLLEKFGAGRERRTEIRSFDTITANVVAANNQKLYVNRGDGFVGYGLKKDEYICDCSDMDDIIAFREDGKFMVSRLTEKVFMGKEIMHVGVFKRNDERMVYNMIYVNGQTSRSLAKRFQVIGVTRDKEYDLVKGAQNSRVRYISANPNGEAETVAVKLSSGCRARKKIFDFDFSMLEIKGRGAGGNIISRYPVRRIELKTEGVSTLSGLDIWYDETIGRLNRDARGTLLGNFDGEDRIFVAYEDGSYEITGFQLTTHYEHEKIRLIEKFEADTVVSVVYRDGKSKNCFVKRFRIETSTKGKRFSFISEGHGSKLLGVTSLSVPSATVVYKKDRKKQTEEVQLDQLIEVKGWKSIGNKFPFDNVISVEIGDGVLLPDPGVTEKSGPTIRRKKPKPKAGQQSKGDVQKIKSAQDSTDTFEVGSTVNLDVQGSSKAGDDVQDQLGLF